MSSADGPRGFFFGSIPVDWKKEFLGVDIPEGEPPVIGGDEGVGPGSHPGGGLALDLVLRLAARGALVGGSSEVGWRGDEFESHFG